MLPEDPASGNCAKFLSIVILQPNFDIESRSTDFGCETGPCVHSIRSHHPSQRPTRVLLGHVPQQLLLIYRSATHYKDERYTAGL